LALILLPSKLDSLVSVLSLLAEYAIKESRENDITQNGCVRFVMSLFKKYEKATLFSLIHVSSRQNACWGLSVSITTHL